MRTLILVIAAGTIPALAATVDFERDVKPILRDNCYECHGPTQQNGSLRLDRKEFAMVGGGRVDIVAGLPDRSRVYRRIAGIDHPQMPPESPLSADEIATIKTWIEQGAVWPDDDSSKRTWQSDARVAPLMIQIRKGNFAAVRTAVTADLTLAQLRDANGVSLLEQAALYATADDVKWLLAQKADANAADLAGLTPLMLAIEDTEKVHALLAAGADPNTHSAAGRTALLNAVDQKRSSVVLKELLAHGAKADPEKGQPDPLLTVTRNGDIESMKLMAAARGGKFPGPALNSAALSNCIACLQLVLDQNPSKQAISGALRGSAIMARTDVLAILISAGADPNTKDKNGRTPLMLAVYSDFADPARVKLLLDHGADVNTRAQDGDTALKEAKKKGSTKIVEMLVAAGEME